MIDTRSVIENTDWAGLHHAYGDAADAPGELLALLSEDPASCGAALAFLDAAVLHQGTLYPATAPAARFVAGILSDQRTLVLCESDLPWDDRNQPLRAALLEWLGSVFESVSFYEDDEEEDEELEEDEDQDADSVAACKAILRDVYLAVLPLLDSPDIDVRQAAVGAMGHLMVAPELAEFRPEQAERMERLTHHSSVSDRAAAALTLGKWDLAPRAFLHDPDPFVRAVAALAPALDQDPAALAEIRHALTDPAAADDWFSEHVPEAEGKFRFALIATLLRRTSDIDEILPEALAVARITSAYTVDNDWGPLLKRAFPEPYAPGAPLTAPQQQLLSAIVDNDECWDSISNPVLWFRRVGLPDKRASIRALVS